MRALATAALAALSLAYTGTAPLRAQSDLCPRDTIEMVVALAPGTGIDVATRTLAEKMSRILGRTIVVLNLPGADGEIGARYVHRASPDGCVLGSLPSGALVAVTLTKTLRKQELPYDPLTGFTPIGKTFGFAFVIGVGRKFSNPTAESVAVYAKANPGMLKLSVSVPPHDLAIGLFRRHFGITVISVPYRRGDVTAVPDILSGVLDGGVMTVNAALPHIETGAFQPLGVFAAARHPHLPHVPTFAELGMNESSVVVPVQGLFGPPGLPAPMVARLNAALKEALADTEVAALLLRQGATPDPSSPQALADGISAQLRGWKQLLEEKVIEIK